MHLILKKIIIQSYILLLNKPDKRKLSQTHSRIRTSICDKKENSYQVEMTKSAALPWLKVPEITTQSSAQIMLSTWGSNCYFLNSK